MKKALLFGAGGFVGSYLLEGLLSNPEYGQVTIVVRKELPVSHPKLKSLIGDCQSLPGLKDSLDADDVFIALGTTKKKTPDRDAYYQADHDYPVLAASIARERGATSLFLVSAVGADVNSGVFYVRTKGEAERDILTLDYDHTHIFRPSMIMGHRKEYRPLEKVLIAVWSLLEPLFIGGLSKYRGTDARDIARAMINAASRPAGKTAVYEWREMRALL